jgi:hypothetical protein
MSQGKHQEAKHGSSYPKTLPQAELGHIPVTGAGSETRGHAGDTSVDH